MTDPEASPNEPPRIPQYSSANQNRPAILADWIAQHRRSFTDAALEQSAVASGYTTQEFADAVALLAARDADPEASPLNRSHAQKWVLIAYGIVWLLFAVAFLGPWAADSFGPMLLAILSVSLGIALGISILIVKRGRPDPSRPLRALVLLLVIPVILLLGIAGLCLPTTGGIVV